MKMIQIIELKNLENYEKLKVVMGLVMWNVAIVIIHILHYHVL